MNQYQNSAMEPEKFITIAVNLLHRSFIDSPRDEAKRLFAEIKAGKTIHLVRIKLEDTSELAVDLALDCSEYVGKLNYAAFKNVMQAMLVCIAKQVQSKAELNVFTDAETGNIIFNLPGVVEDDEHVNMLVLGAQREVPGAVTLKLQFLDVSQFIEESVEKGESADGAIGESAHGEQNA